MNKEFVITKKYNNNNNEIFNPFYLDIIKKRGSIILSNNNDLLNQDTLITNKNVTNIISDINELENLFFDYNYMLLANFNIKNVNDIFDNLMDIINYNNNIETIDIIFTMILYNYKDQFKDILNIDKLINIYKMYLKYDDINYKKIFEIIKDNFNKEDIDIYIHYNIYKQYYDYHITTIYNIKKIDDIYDVLIKLIDDKNNIIDNLLNFILEKYAKDFDKNNIDKLIDIYKKYLNDNDINYKKIYKIIEDNLSDNFGTDDYKHRDIINKLKFKNIIK